MREGCGHREIRGWSGTDERLGSATARQVRPEGKLYLFPTDEMREKGQPKQSRDVELRRRTDSSNGRAQVSTSATT